MSDAGSPALRTPLHDAHVAAGARMTAFAGWAMPLQYEGIIAEHMAVRRSAGIFDVSHMGELRVRGAERIASLQRVLSNDLARIAHVGEAQYTLLLNDEGGVEDDLIAYRTAPNELLLVVNAANRAHDARLLDGIAEDESDAWGMLALQGPDAIDVLTQRLDVDVRSAPAFTFVEATLCGAASLVTMTGYTGERGCELLVPIEHVADVWDALHADERVTACGLGARDTLRLEAGFPLHGNDLDAAHDAFSSAVGFAAPAAVHERGVGGAGHAALERIRAAGPRERLVALLVQGRGIARAGTHVMSADGARVGVATSGTMSPVLRQGIALARVDAAYASLDTELAVDVRGAAVPARVVRRPFVQRAAGARA